QTDWQGANENPLTDIFDWNIGSELSVGYWFRLKNKRVEFIPTLYYAQHSSDLEVDLGTFGFEFNVNVYPFDFGGDCDCPTFGKQGPKLEKGFFIHLTPGYAFYNLTSPVATFESASGLTLGGGVGLDIGITNLLTITPLASYRLGMSGFAGELPFTDANGQLIGTDDPNISSLQIGLRALIRFDHKRY
ncbi:MAG: hypothetical protein AAF597_09970, partial [Bacteroidota bacterium]